MGRRWESRRAHVVFVVALGLVVPAYLVTSDLARDLVSATAAAVPILVLGTLLARRRIAAPRPWQLLFAGILVLGAYTVVWMVDVHRFATVPAGPIITLGPPISYLLFLTAAAVIAARPAGMRGGIVDAAIFALSASLLAWALLLGPYVERLDMPTATRMRTMAAVVVLGATAGAIIGAARDFRTGRWALRYLLVAAASAATGTVAREVTASPQAISGAWWVGLIWVVAYCALLTAVLDPATLSLTPTSRPRTTRITPVTLVALGAALYVGPIVALAQTASGAPVDGLVIGVGGVALVPLVLLRIAQLARLHAAAEQRLTHLADHDELTGLANRRRLHAHVAAVLARVERGEADGVVVLFCDVDGFKAVNDDHGHHIGDEVLLAITQRLRSAVRPDDLVARFGGDEFVVVVEGDPAVTEAETLARVGRALAEPMTIGTLVASTAVSVGSASAVRGAGITPDRLLAAADASMYAHKRAHRADRPDRAHHPELTGHAPTLPRQGRRSTRQNTRGWNV